MRWNKGNGWAIVLIALGALILFGKLTPLLGYMMGYLIPILMIALGYYGVKRGNTTLGWIVLIIGIIALIGKLSWLLGPIIAIGLIILGVSMLGNKRNSHRRY
ncbi:LiaF transmembrane domain-containing protein [Paenibacillus tundrae]|uniref:LiaF transmembrane domain-containing protein n=1 Tax=Paenibacillus tundrae TaxID=528187 RepID=UPI0030D461BA